MRNNTAPDHIVTREEFQEYYNNVSASIDDDEYFAVMMTNAWNLDNKSYGKGWGGQVGGTQGGNLQKAAPQQQRPESGYGQRPESAYGRDRPQSSYSQSSRASQAQKAGPTKRRTDEELIQVVRDKLASRGARGIAALGRTFRIWDHNKSGFLDYKEAGQAVKDMRMGLDHNECMRLAKAFDRDGDGTISYNEFLWGVRGEMNDFRKKLCMRAFDVLDVEKNGIIDINDIRHSYNAKQHPDVVAGKKTEDDVLFDFLETFDVHHHNSKDHPQDA